MLIITVCFEPPKAVTHLKPRPLLTLERKILKCKKPVIDRLFCGGGGEIRTHDISLAKRKKWEFRGSIWRPQHIVGTVLNGTFDR
jgi:hypothetical protein